jgi:hypothetical protein
MTIYPMAATTLGNAESRFVAQEAFVALLWTDPRVERAYECWRGEFGLDELIARLQQAPDVATRDAVRGEFRLRYDDAGAVVRRVMTTLLVEFPPFPWLSERLAAAFLVDLVNEVEPGFQVQTSILVPPQPQRGRRAKGGADRVRRDVEWFYRVHVQQPHESVRALAREYIRVGRLPVTSDARATVQDGIASARILLE